MLVGRQEYNDTRRYERDRGGDMILDAVKDKGLGRDDTFQRLIDEVREEETRFLKTINYPFDKDKTNWYF